MNMPVGRGYKINANQAKCFELVALINSVVPGSASTNYNEGRGYFVDVRNDRRYYPAKIEAWELVTAHYQRLKNVVVEREDSQRKYDNTLAEIRGNLTEAEQLLLGIHANQRERFNETLSKLSDAQQTFVIAYFH